MESITQLAIRSQKEGFDKLTKEELNKLKEYLSSTIQYRQGLDKLAAQFDLEKIDKLLTK